MFFVGKIWEHDALKKEIYYTAENDIVAMQKLSAAIPNGCRATYEEIDEKIYFQKTETKTEAQAKAEA